MWALPKVLLSVVEREINWWKMKGCLWTASRTVVQHVFAEIRAEKDQWRDHMADESTWSCRCFSEPCAKNMVYIKIGPFRTILAHAELLNMSMLRKASLEPFKSRNTETLCDKPSTKKQVLQPPWQHVDIHQTKQICIWGLPCCPPSLLDRRKWA